MSFSADRLLRFSPVAAGGSGHWHIYYGQYYVGTIQHLSGAWFVRHHGIPLGQFAQLEEAKTAVAQWYYGPECTADGSDSAANAPLPAAESTRVQMTYGNDFPLACAERACRSSRP